MKKFIFLCLVTIMLASCSNSSNESNQKNHLDISDLKEEVMDLHDEIMPQMGTLRKVEKQLRTKADSIAEVDSLGAVRHTTVADAISTANEDMMNWMRGFEPNFTGTEAEVKSYFEEQKQGIIKVKENMEKSLKEGEDLVNQ